MPIYTLRRIQKIPAPVQEVWDFFSTPGNLKTITPPGMGFKVISAEDNRKMYVGQLIEYKVRPFLGIPLYWMTHIEEVKDKELFIDEQRKGPYRMWHHEHHFKTIEGGTEMTDIIQYKNPFGILGGLINWIVIKKKLENIFDFRYKKTEEIFGKWNEIV